MKHSMWYVIHCEAQRGSTGRALGGARRHGNLCPTHPKDTEAQWGQGALPWLCVYAVGSGCRRLE
jgi:hypothetical protein